jgi:hypothetical protein
MVLNFTANLFISEEKVWVIKVNSHYFILASFRNVNNIYKIVDMFQTFLIFFVTKKWEIMLLNFTANLFISEEKVWVIKLSSHYFVLASFRNVDNFYKIVDRFQTFLIFLFTKKWEIMLLNYFHEYATLLHPNFSLFWQYL